MGAIERVLQTGKGRWEKLGVESGGSGKKREGRVMRRLRGERGE